MLSYQHIFHAGNFADIHKHLSLVCLLAHLNKKEKPYIVFDTHAGSARYDLQDERAQKTQESQSGILRLQEFYQQDDDDKNNFPELLTKYLEIVNDCLSESQEKSVCPFYPGSPEITMHMVRAGDKIILSEKHPAEIICLKKNIEQSRKDALERSNFVPDVHIHFRDGFETLLALSPPQIKRGLVLIDPSYEETSDYVNVAKTVCEVFKKWNSAIFAIWYPILAVKKNDLQIMKDTIKACVKSRRSDIDIADVQMLASDSQKLKGTERGLLGSGMFVVNAPWKFTESVNECAEVVQRCIGHVDVN